MMSVRVSRPIAAGEQICISYVSCSDDSRSERRSKLKQVFGFKCLCELCNELTAEMRAITKEKEAVLCAHCGMVMTGSRKDDPMEVVKYRCSDKGGCSRTRTRAEVKEVVDAAVGLCERAGEQLKKREPEKAKLLADDAVLKLEPVLGGSNGIMLVSVLLFPCFAFAFVGWLFAHRSSLLLRCCCGLAAASVVVAPSRVVPQRARQIQSTIAGALSQKCSIGLLNSMEGGTLVQRRQCMLSRTAAMHTRVLEATERIVPQNDAIVLRLLIQLMITQQEMKSGGAAVATERRKTADRILAIHNILIGGGLESFARLHGFPLRFTSTPLVSSPSPSSPAPPPVPASASAASTSTTSSSLVPPKPAATSSAPATAVPVPAPTGVGESKPKKKQLATKTKAQPKKEEEAKKEEPAAAKASKPKEQEQPQPKSSEPTAPTSSA